mgnify:FL=1
MTQVCSLTSSTADVKACESKTLPKGIRIVGADDKSASKVKGMPIGEEDKAPWGYLFIQHYAAECFDRKLVNTNLDGEFVPKCFIHRTLNYKQKPNGKGVIKEERPSVSGLVFLQGETKDLRLFLQKNFPQYHLVNNCMTGKPASIPNSVMEPFMKVMSSEPERVTFLRDPFVKFAKDHVKLRVLTGLFTGQEGYVVRKARPPVGNGFWRLCRSHQQRSQ